MRKYIKTRCLETLGLLEEAHWNLEKLLGTRNYGEAAGLLEQCQQAAISVGAMIEQQEGEGTDPVHRLEEYCELAYQLHQECLEEGHASSSTAAGKTEKSPEGSHLNHMISGKSTVAADSLRNAAPRRIRKLEKCVHRAASGINAFSVKAEAVFLPYKASMWDSLESVWKAADEDPNCDAYVIPIPYFDKNPDGSAKQIHYEGNQYPKYVPITHYENYDFAEQHPDQIYIHSPYDEYNFVTSLDPFFYSSNLKNYTEELVYIPYYILAKPPEELWEWKPEDREKYLESLENFAILPGVINSDRVILQSEAMKKCFVEILTKQFGKETRRDWEKKLFGTGSPKVDKVLNTRIEDLEITEDWQRIIQKPDGTRKKIILYNTGLSAMLKDNERMLAKIKDVFRVFEENKDEVALLWRPHPLLEATLESMRAELAQEYGAIKEKYLEEGHGIYDDSPDLDRAIILSDAYYGDMSSVVWLYQKTGKPVMIQNVEILYSVNDEMQSIKNGSYPATGGI